MFAILKKEFKTYFVTPVGYIFITIFLLMLSATFYLYTYLQGSTRLEYVVLDSSVILTFIIPLLTMRMFSEERKNGTEQLLLTSPRSITAIVLGKFFAAGII